MKRSSFKLPDLGEGLQEAEIVAWHVSPGDRVVADQPLVSVETDKAVVEIPAPQSGRIAQLFGAVGDRIAVGEELVLFAEGQAADTGAVVGNLPNDADPVKKAPQIKKAVGPRSNAGKATPAVRVLASSLGVDLASVAGTGPEGTVTSEDVRAASADAGGGEPLRGARRSMAENMARAGAEVVPATIQDVANVMHWPENIDPTLRLIRAIAEGVRAEPRLNSWFEGTQARLSVQDRLNLGLAVDTPDGLFVPVVEDVDSLDDAQLRDRLDDLKTKILERSATRRELTGQTFTLSNFGMIAGRHVTLVVLPPQVAILGAGRIDEQVVAVDGKVVICRILPLSLTFDHRAISGGEAARFLAAVISDLER